MTMTTVMAARSSTVTLCRRAVFIAVLVRVATSSGSRHRQSRSTDLEPSESFIFDIGTGRRRLPVAMTATNVRHLSTDAMFGKLGPHFDADWMSVDQPTVIITSGFRLNRSRDDPELVRDLRRLRFAYRDDRGAERRMDASAVMELERWLLQLARCDVIYTWEDMGQLFWPRWVRHGRCDSLAVCSWPPGMYCAPAPSETLRLLHWQCRRRPSTVHRVARHDDDISSSSLIPRSGNRQARRRRLRTGRQPLCRWKKVPYPVTSDCFCSC